MISFKILIEFVEISKKSSSSKLWKLLNNKIKYFSISKNVFSSLSSSFKLLLLIIKISFSFKLYEFDILSDKRTFVIIK